MATEKFLSEFPPVSPEEWEAAILEDLKGADAASLLWKAEDGLELRPFYRAEDTRDLAFAGVAPGEFPYARGARRTGEWRIREEIDAADPEEANRQAREAIASGAEEIAFRGASIQSTSDLAVLVAQLDGIPVRFEGAGERELRVLLERLRKHPHGAEVSTSLDAAADFGFAAELFAANLPRVTPFTIATERLQDKGAASIEEVGCALAAGVDFLEEMQKRGIAVDRAAESIGFAFAMGPQFLVQIAKLRAFRMVWARAAESFGVSREAARARIYARTLRWNQTPDAPHVNILRGTMGAMSAVLGGADSILVAPFDGCGTGPGDLSRRLARNTQIILKREALLGRVADPAGGSYSIEAITDAIAAGAWKVLQQVEAQGGYRSSRTKVD